MSNYRIWPIAVLVIAGLVYFWGDEDQPEAEKTIQQQAPPVVSTKPPAYRQKTEAPIWTPPGNYPAYNAPAYSGRSQEYGVPGAQTPGQFNQPGGLRFRPDQEEAATRQDYQTSYPPQQGRGYPMTTQDQGAQNPYNYGPYPQQTDNYRFRPLDKQRQDRRWEGNYPQPPNRPSQQAQPYPYPYTPSYTPGPAYPSRSADSTSLWANSWQER
jgi:hypothetical protein